MKKLIALVLALAMVLMVGAAFATSYDSAHDAGSGSITIDNPISGQTYTIYKVFDVTYNADHTAFSYTISGSSPFYDAVVDSNFFTLEQIGSTGVYNVINKTTGGMTGAPAGSEPTTAQTNAKELAAALRAVVEAGNAGAAAATLPNSGSYTASDLALGYYFINSSAGALCTLDTTTPSVTVKEKNEVPTVVKEVKEGETWGKTSDGEIGDTVEFRTTIHAQPGAFNYVLYDAMDDGLTFSETINSADNITVKVGSTPLTKGAQGAYTVAYNQTVNQNAYTFVITFNNDWLKQNITTATDIIVTYSGVINSNAVVAVPELNDTYLKYGNNSETNHDTTRTYTWEVDVYKYTGTEATPLAGVTFKLVNSAKTKAATFDSNWKLNGWVDLASGDSADNGIVSVGTALTTTSANGSKLHVYGLDEGTYYLVETVTPAGYNKLTGPVTVTITSAESDSSPKTLTATVTNASRITGDEDTTNYIKVNNQTGTTLPSTGGIGTTIFYILGGLLVIGAAVILVARRKASN